MNLKKGDTIVVIDDAIRGTVSRVNGHKIFIDSEDGFELVFEESDLVKIEVEQSELAKKIVVPMHLSQKVDFEKKKKGHKVKKKKEYEHTMEVDLHIEKLIKSTRNMDNYDKLSLQMDTAKHKLEFAIRNRIPKIVFIHGVGEGVLKKELSYLFNRYPVKVSEASYQKYGMGATEVYILQNAKGL
ncbi:MAG: DNA mismatch repair protein MutS [Urechidicola sp.]|nr:DNA mismatch repair protein MutS [Urechidicola sp.]